MRVKFANKFTGSVMYVDAAREKEYMAAGHKPAAKPAEKTEQAPTPRKTTKKKAGA